MAGGSTDVGAGTSAPAPLHRPPRGPATVSGALVAALLIALAAVALTARQDSPPTVAELAPQAVTQITEELSELAPTSGGGAGGGAATTTTTAAPEVVPGEAVTTTTAPVKTERVRRCIGDPPRQTEDPQSPPCVPYFEGDNGGATTKGVSANEIRIAYPKQGFEDITLGLQLAQYFNRRYEMYGRSIVLQPYDTRGGGFAQPNPPDMKADAHMVATEKDSFASLGYVDRKGSEHHYYDELARLGVISATYRAQQVATEARFAALAPYQWGWLPPTDQSLRLIGGFACRSLAGRPPRHAGAPTNAAAKRKFGVIYQRTPDGSVPDLGEMVDGMRACGATPVLAEDQTDAVNGQQRMLRMTDEDVTTVICICNPGTLKDAYMPAATQQGFFPEWVVSGLIDQDLDNSFHGAPPDQASHVFGLSFRDPVLARQDMPWYWAIKEVQPSSDPSGGRTYALMARYEQLALLAAGIQMAGPNLTPKTFEAGLHKARFANPNAGAPPYFQAKVGFPGGRHTMADDATLFWYSPSEGGTVDPGFPGAVCYVRRGLRYTAPTFPSNDDGFFTPPCR